MAMTGSSYYCDVYHDILDDFDCLLTRFRFDTEPLAKEFVENVVTKFVCTDIYFEKVRQKSGNSQDRPTYSSLRDALDDAEEFYKYGDSDKYRFHGNVFIVDLDKMTDLYQRRQIKELHSSRGRE